MGLTFGFLIGFVLFELGFRISIIAATFLIIPLIIDGFTQLLEIRESCNIIRLLTGFFFMIGLFLM